MVETVGVGQTELEITGAADTVVVILVPESGDAIQAMKAGLMEIADIFVVNKSDRPGADRLEKDLKLALHLKQGEALKDVPAHHGVDLRQLGVDAGEPPKDEESGAALAWEIPVLQTVAHSGEGIPEVMDAITQHRKFLEASGVLDIRRKARAEGRVRDVVERELKRVTWADPSARRLLKDGVEEILSGGQTPYSLAGQLLARLLAPHLGSRDPGGRSG